MKRFALLFGALLLSGMSHAATSTAQPFVLPTALTVSSVTAAGAVAIATVTVPTSVGPYSTGYFNYITHIRIEMYATSTLTGGATPVTCTTTNLPGNPVYKLPTAAATGTVTVIDQVFDNALQSSAAGTNTLVTCPATSNVIWNITVNYFQSN